MSTYLRTEGVAPPMLGKVGGRKEEHLRRLSRQASVPAHRARLGCFLGRAVVHWRG
jgi:hypothetical protein